MVDKIYNEDIFLYQDQMLIKKVGYKSLRGAIKMLKSQNKRLKKLNCVCEFTIRLPIKD